MFQPDPDPVISLADEQSVAEVWVSGPETAEAWSREKFWEEATSFLLRCKRWAGTGNRKLRRAIQPGSDRAEKDGTYGRRKKTILVHIRTVSLQTESGAKTPSGNRPARDLYLRRIFCPEFRMAQSSGGPGVFYGLPQRIYASVRRMHVRHPGLGRSGHENAGRLDDIPFSKQ